MMNEIEEDMSITYLRAILGDTPYVIAGGYARDKYYGVQPKDIDVFISVKHIGAIKDRIVNSGYSFVHHGHGYTGSCFTKPTKNTDHLEQVVKVGCVDFIFVRDDINLQIVTDYFDFNINQFKITCTGRLEYMGIKGCNVLDQLHDDVPDGRILKMFKYFQSRVKDGSIKAY